MTEQSWIVVVLLFIYCYNKCSIYESIGKYIMNGADEYISTHDAVKFIGSARKAARKMATRYNQKKQAYVASTECLHKTGNLDMSRIARYRVSDEIFDKRIVTNSGKSHGLVCALDFSWSMDTLLIPMAKQLLILSLFCKYAKIKFQFF